jgi:hypothetical protein
MKAISASIGFVLLISTTGAWAMCSTADSSCSGEVSFGPFIDASLCFAVYQGENRSDFCLRPGEKEEVSVRTGDTFCGVRGFVKPASDCARSAFNVR